MTAIHDVWNIELTWHY